MVHALLGSNTCDLDGTGGFEKLVGGLKHRMVFAVATTDTVLFYDTEQIAPFATVAHLHLATITDLSWRVHAHHAPRTTHHPHTSTPYSVQATACACLVLVQVLVACASACTLR